MWFIWTSLFTVLFTGTPAASQSTPTGFAVKACYPTALQLTWKASVDALYYQLYTGGTTLVLPGSSTTYNVTHLKPYTYHTFYLQTADYSGLSDSANTGGMTCPGGPESITNVVTKVLSEDSLSVDWKNPADYHGPKGATKLHLWTPNGRSAALLSLAPSAVTFTFTMLKPGLPYYVSLMASTQPENQCGGCDGKEFLAGPVYLESKDQSIAAPVVTLTVTGATGLRAEWTQEVPATQPEILAYTYKLTETEGGRLVRIGYLPVTARSLALNKLTPFTAYDLEVSANGLYTHGIAHVSATTAPGVPGAVQDLYVTQSVYSVSARWREPLYSPGRVSSYRCVLYSGSLPTQWKTVEDTYISFGGWDVNGLYRVGVSATISPLSPNLGGGTGPETLSDFDEASTEPEPKPKPPSGLRAQVIGPNAIKLTWTAPSYPNVPVYYYKITINAADGVSLTEVAPSAALLRVLTGLRPDTKYDIVMQTVSMQTESAKSKPAIAITSHGVPSAPENVKATLIKPTEAKVVWTEPKYKGSGVAGYIVTVRWGGDVVKARKVVEGTSCIVRNLPEFAELVLAVTATSAEGTGKAGLSNSVYTQATA